LALRELGVSLEQIRRLLDDDISVQEIRGMFTLRKALIEQQLQDEEIRLRTVAARLQHLEELGDLGDFDVVLKSIPAQPIMAAKTMLPTMFDAFDIVQEMVTEIQFPVKKSLIG